MQAAEQNSKKEAQPRNPWNTILNELCAYAKTKCKIIKT